MNKLTADRLRELLSYDPEIGLFTWRINRRGGSQAGSLAGAAQKNGYIRVMISRQSYCAHRLAWLYVHGRWPIAQIDHINGVRDDNRLSNLREATHSENQHNKKNANANSRSRLIGVDFTKKGWWRAQIRIRGEKRYLGSYRTPEEASAAYLSAKAKLHPYSTLPLPPPKDAP